MEIESTPVDGVLILTPKVFGDERGFFLETYQQERYEKAGIQGPFVQDNLSRSRKGVLRGLHFQNPNSQGKLVQVFEGEVFDVAVDLRRSSSTFGQWVGVTLSGENKKQFYVPPGFAHGFCGLTESVLFTYKCTDYYNVEAEHGIAWDDPEVGIDWPIDEPILSEKDRTYPRLADLPEDQLFP